MLFNKIQFWVLVTQRNFEQFQAFGMIFLRIIRWFILLLHFYVCDEKEVITVHDCSELLDSKILLHSYIPLEIWGINFNK